MKNRAYQKVWQYIKTMRYFTLVELHILLTLDNEDSLNYSDLEIYILGLKNFEIIKEFQDDNYILCREMGTLAPQIFNNYLIYDPNNNNNDCTKANFSNGILTHKTYCNNTLSLYNGGNND